MIRLMKSKKYKITLIGSIFLLFLIFLAIPNNTFAAVRTWDGGGSDGTCGGVAGDGNKWSCAANWSADSTPTSSDSVVFDGTSTKDATLDSSFQGTVTGMTISSGYSGTITQARALTISGAYSQAAGTFNGASQAISVSSTFSLTGGTFRSTSGTLTVQSSFTVSGLPTFNANSGSITFSGSGGSILSCNNVTFSSVTLSMQFADRTITIGSNCNIQGGNSPTWVGTITNNGTITLGTGTLNLNGNLTNNGTVTTSLTELYFAEPNGGGSFTNNGTLTMGSSPIIRVSAGLNFTSGTQPSGITLYAQDSSSGGTITCGSYSFASFIVNKTWSDRYISIASSCGNNSLPLGNDPTSTGTIYNGGTLNVGTGTWTINGDLSNSGTITTSLSELDVMVGNCCGGSFTNTGTLTMNANPTMIAEESFLYTSGTIPNNTALTLQSGNSGSINCGAATFASLSINKLYIDRTLTPTGNCAIAGNLTITGGSIPNPASAYVWTIGGNVLQNNSNTSSTFGGANLTLEMNGAVDKTISSNTTIGAKLKVNKSVGNSVTMASNIVLGNTLEVASGTFDQGATFNLTIGGATTVSAFGTWSNTGTGDITLGGDVTNSGSISLDGSGSSCGGVDAIVINSSASPTQRTWSGAGTFTLYDLSVSNMAGSMTTRSSTNTSNNAWTFLACNNNPSSPSITSGSVTDGAWGTDNTPTFNFTLSDTDVSDTVKYQIQIDDSSDFLSPVVDYTSELDSQGSFEFTVGQAVGSGNYTTGSFGQTISDSSAYYWRVKAIDNYDGESGYSTANSGGVAFKVDTVPPTPGSVSSSDITTSSITISISGSVDALSDIATYLFQNTTLSTDSGATTSTSWIDSSLSPAVGYSYSVSVYDNAGNSSTSALYLFTTEALPVVVQSNMQISNGQPDLFGKVNVQPYVFKINNNIPVTTSTEIIIFKKKLSLNSRGDDVKLLQVFLNNHGYILAKSGPGSPGNETNLFGSLTQKAIQKFQCDNGIVCNGTPATTGYGLLGPKTRSEINKINNK